ncbi:Zn(II)2Cys6 transcription factor domain-containing protein [Aspergillus undulatus]|uniref:Zn(II)2Cys6 transcription factor domain-containing protein n=1 Tax=Aspergillus undulatus TaxID=1810928 RepID=UPI003CCD3A08
MSSAPGSGALTASDPDDAILSIAPLTVTQMSASDPDRESDVSVKKRKRVRTGCFTCRDRHLKCDAAHGQCQNCLKSGRLCRRGVRLNFVDTQVVAPPTYIRPPAENGVTFRDDSRVIASEYVGGDEVYPPLDKVPQLEVPRETSTPVHSSELNPFFKEYSLDRRFAIEDPMEVSLMQVFANQIGPWLDVVDEMKHFSRLLPFYALENPLLRAVIAACAGCFVFLQLSNEASERLRHYTAAAEMLSDLLKSPKNDSSLCAVAALLVEVTETLLLGPIESGLRIRATNSARALIRACHWNTCTQGLGGACSWVNIIMELLDCITFRQTLTWDPGTWGVDMSFASQPSRFGNEHLWTQRIMYICAKVSDFRSLNAHDIGNSTRNAETRRAQEHSMYTEWCDKWFASIPRSMLPVGQVEPWRRNPQSVFPEICFLERSAVVTQVLFHITRIMLIETDPLRQGHLHEMQEEQQRHAYRICGIVSSDKKNGIPLFSTPLLAIAAGYLFERHAQEEALAILDEIQRTTGVNTDYLRSKLPETWGWLSNGHEPFADSIDNTAMSMDFHAPAPGHEYHDASITDPFSHSLMEAHPYLDHHINYDQ